MIAFRLRRARAQFFACALGILAVCPTAFAGSINDLDPKQFCPAAGGELSNSAKYRLVRLLVETYNIPYDIVDWNDSGINYDEYAGALIALRCNNRKCRRKPRIRKVLATALLRNTIPRESRRR